MLKHSAADTGFASATEPYCYPVGGSDCNLEAQIAAWRVRLHPGGADCSLEAQITAWSLRWKLAGADYSLEGEIANGSSDSTLEGQFAWI